MRCSSSVEKLLLPSRKSAIQADFKNNDAIPQFSPPIPLHNPVLIATTPDLVWMRPKSCSGRSKDKSPYVFPTCEHNQFYLLESTTKAEATGEGARELSWSRSSVLTCSQTTHQPSFLGHWGLIKGKKEIDLRVLVLLVLLAPWMRS